MKLRERVGSSLAVSGELIGFFWKSQWWWLVPLLVMLLPLGMLFIVAQSSAIAPFIYTLF
jgi:uncharacterized membrane protein